MSAPVHEPEVPAAVERLIVALPKVELHLHLEGSMQPGLLLELADKHGVAGLPDTLQGVRKWYEFRDFEHFIAVYEAAVHTLRDEEDFARLVEQTAAGLAAQNVSYAEVILTPHARLTRGVSAEAIFGGIEVDREPFTDVFARARAAGLRSIPHAGETHGPDRIWSAIQQLRADRIGHGIHCLDDPTLVEHSRTPRCRWRSVPPRTCAPAPCPR